MILCCHLLRPGFIFFIKTTNILVSQRGDCFFFLNLRSVASHRCPSWSYDQHTTVSIWFMCFTFTNLLLFSLCVCFLFSEITCQVIVTFFGFVWVRIFLSHTFDLLTMSYTVYVAFYVYPTHSSYNSQWAEMWKVSFWKKKYRCCSNFVFLIFAD